MAEAAALTKLSYAEGIADVVNAFETVPHAILADIAKSKGYSMATLRLCLAAYRLRLAIGVDGTFSRTIIATRGINGGAGFATSELRL